MKSLNVKLPHKTYPIYIKRGLFGETAEKIKEIFKGEKICIVTDTNVGPLYSKKLTESLQLLGYETKVIVVPAGESSKSIGKLTGIYSELIEFQLTRSDLIVALGGGVVGDLTGFVASTYLRGVSFVQVPTSLLAQIDSSVGGKVAVNVPEGKNLVGSFYHPEMVIIDPDLLKTLDSRYLNDGMAEVIKYGCIRDVELFNKCSKLYESHDIYSELEEIIYTCCDIKRDIVERDELDNGERMLLNFGHTIGHGIEKVFNFNKYTHGEGVAIGMYQITKNAEKQGLTIEGTAQKIKEVLIKCKLPFEVENLGPDDIRKTILSDKKRKGSFINLVLVKDIGEGYLEKIEIEKIDNFI